MNQSAPSSSEFPALSLVDVEGDFSMNRSFTYGKYFVSFLLYELQIQECTKYVILEAGSARALPWTRIGDGEVFEPASSYALSTSSQHLFVLRAILAIRRPLINELARPGTCNVHPSISMST